MFVLKVATKLLKIRVPFSQLSVNQVLFGMMALIRIAAQVVTDLIEQQVVGGLPAGNFTPQFLHEPQQPAHADVFLAQYLNGMCHAPILPLGTGKRPWR